MQLLPILNELYINLLNNANLVLFCLTIIVIVIDRRKENKLIDAQIIYRWFALIYLCGTYVLAAIQHLQIGNFAGALNGRVTHSVHFEVAGLELILAIIFLGGFNARFGWRLAVVLFSAAIAWIAAGDTLYQAWNLYGRINLPKSQLLDVIVPIIMLSCLRKLRVK